jgi:acetyl esterase/lipase
MKLEPEVQAFVDAERPVSLDDIDAARRIRYEQANRNFARFGMPGPAVERVVDHQVPTSDGTILVRTYHPEGSSPRPAHVMLHGGGWVWGSVTTLVNDAKARHRAIRADCVAVQVEYRKAPEHRFPAALQDAVASLRWVLDNAAGLGVDTSCVTLEGTSSGGNLAAAVPLYQPDLPIAALVLNVPALDLTGETVPGPRDGLTRLAEFYLGDPSLATSPLVSPLLAPDLSGFPPTLVLAAEHDHLAPGDQLFAEKLRACGVESHYTCYPGAVHSTDFLTGTWATARRWQDDVLAFLSDIHARPRPQEATHE